VTHVPPIQNPVAPQRKPDGGRGPELGQNDGFQFRDVAATTWPRAWLRRALVGVGLVLLAALLVLRRPLADRVWPEARAQALREQAALALAHGRLTAVDGSGARELYEAALAIDPDRNDARVGLMRVAQAALAQARSAIAADRYADAHAALQLARMLSAPRAQTNAVDAELRKGETSHAGIERLLVQAAAARAAHRLDGGNATALPLYRYVLALQPNRVEALEGREDALADLLQQAHLALQRGDILQAARLVAVAREYDPGHGDLPNAQAGLAKALEQAHQHADAELRHGRIERAAGEYRALLQIDAIDATAQRGIEQVATAWARRAERLAADFRFGEARAALAQARALAPQSAALPDAARSIARAQQAKGRLGVAMPKAERARRVRRLLVEAAAAEARGELLTPPGDSAFDKLRAARALAPDDAAVRRSSARLLPAAHACFERELRSNNLGRARACLDARVALEGDGAVAAHARRQLAQRWLAIGAERLGAGEIQAAEAALKDARSLDAAAPGLQDFAERLKKVGATRRWK
jgi:tetratricopeptide (TPR) repeat protein